MGKNFLLVALLMLAACSKQSLMEHFTTPENQTEVKARFEQLRGREFAAIEQDLDPALKAPAVRATLEKMATLIPPGSPASITLVGAQQHSGPNGFIQNTTLEYSIGGRWFLFNLATKTEAGRSTIVGLNVYPQKASLEEINRFGLVGKSFKHYAVLAGTVGTVLLSLYALVACIRTRIPRRKWLWILFILLGIGKLSLNWTTGALLVAPLSVLLLGGGISAAPYGPWILSLSLPVGAVVFLLRYKWLGRRGYS